MPETAEQYRHRMLANLAGRKSVDILSSTPQKLVRLLKGVPKSKLRKRPAPGKWSVHEIVMHLSDTEIVWGFRVRFILGAPGTPLAGFDQDVWVVCGNYDKRDTAVALEQVAALRKANLALLKSLRPEQWKHAGMHSERGEESVETIAAMMAGHDINHVRQIEHILKPRKGR